MTLRGFKNFIVPSYGAIGDFVLMLYLFEGLHHCIPDMTIQVITTRNEDLLKEMVGDRTYIRIHRASSIAVSRLFFSAFFARNMFLIPPTFTEIPKRVRALAHLFTAVRGVLVGFNGFPDRMNYDESILFDMQIPVHENFKKLLRKLGCEYEGSPLVTLPENTAILSEVSRPYIAIAPFAAQIGKSLPLPRWIDLVKRMQAAHPGHTLVVLGAPSNVPAAEELLQKAGHLHAKVFCNQRFAETVALIKHANVFIGVDSGLSHVAGVLQAPNVIIGNLRNPAWLTTYNPNAIILTESAHCGCHGDKTGACSVTFEGQEYLRCMMEVSQETILAAVQTILSSAIDHD